jgi:hypothetical protein
VGAIGGVIGLVPGVAFGVLLSLAEKRKAVRDIMLTRTAMWGLIASAPIPLLTGREDQLLVLCPIGAAVAVGVVAIAGKAARQPQQQKRVLHVIATHVLRSVQDAVNRTPEESVHGHALTGILDELPRELANTVSRKLRAVHSSLGKPMVSSGNTVCAG